MPDLHHPDATTLPVKSRLRRCLIWIVAMLLQVTAAVLFPVCNFVRERRMAIAGFIFGLLAGWLIWG